MTKSTPQSLAQDARELLLDAQAVQGHAQSRLDEHRGLIDAAAARMAALKADAAESTATPESAAKWRKDMQKVRDDHELLLLQLPGLEKRLADCEQAVRSAKVALEDAEARALDAELQAMMPELREAFSVIVRGWAVHCRRSYGFFSDSGTRFGAWLAGAGGTDGLFDLSDYKPQED